MQLGGYSIRYAQTTSYMEAAKRACEAFNKTDQQNPYLTLLNDYDGVSYESTISNETIAKRLFKEKKLNLSWTANYDPCGLHSCTNTMA